MDFIARVMHNDAVVIGFGLTAMLFAFVGFVLLGAISVASVFVRRVPGGMLTLSGIVVMLAMFSFAQLMTSGMGLQYGPSGTLVQAGVYTYGGFLCVLGYVRLTWHVLRNRPRTDH